MSLAKDVKPYVDNDVYKRFTKMIIKGGTRFYYLLDFGGGKYGVLWRVFINADAVNEIVERHIRGQAINNDDPTIIKHFITGLCYTTNSKQDAIDYIKTATIEDKKAYQL